MTGTGPTYPALAMIGAASVLVTSVLVESPRTMVLLLAATLALSALLEYRRSRDVLSPMILAAVVFAWLYVAKPLHVLDLRTISSGTEADAIPIGGSWDRVLHQSLVAVTLAWCAMFVAFQLVVAHQRPVRQQRRLLLDGVRYGWVALVVAVVDVLAFAVLVLASGGLGAYLEGLALRSESLAGMSFLTLATVPLNLTLLVGLAARLRGEQGAPSRELLALLAGLALLSAFLTGGRAALITGLALPVLLVVHHAGRRIGPLRAVALGCLAIVVFVTLGAVLRDATFHQASGLGPGHFVQERFENLHESLVGGVEAVPYDSLVRLVGERQFGDLPPQGGETYKAIATWPVPRAVWSGKPAGGGNAWFTETYVPRFYGDAKVESSISFVGESWANFGWAGVLVGGVALGTLVGLLRVRLKESPELFALPLYAALLGFLLPTIRGDAYHNVTSVVFACAVWFGLRALLGRSRPWACRARRWRRDVCACEGCARRRSREAWIVRAPAQLGAGGAGDARFGGQGRWRWTTDDDVEPVTTYLVDEATDVGTQPIAFALEEPALVDPDAAPIAFAVEPVPDLGAEPIHFGAEASFADVGTEPISFGVDEPFADLGTEPIVFGVGEPTTPARTSD